MFYTKVNVRSNHSLFSTSRESPLNSPYGGTYIIYYLCIRNQNSLIMETREYFEKVIGSHLGAENIAFMFSLFESCKLNEINFGDYIEDILTRLMEGEQDFMSLIPCNYNSNKKVNVKAA
mgnify:CR=1 FL=1